jgi:FRG domain
MPTSLCVTEVTTISDFMAFVEKKTQIRWYRGAGDSDYDLKPSLYRHLSKTTDDEFNDLELEVISRFRQRSIPYLLAPLSDDALNTLFLMQHFKVPTRLLDWTENPYVALYFALTTARSLLNGPDVVHDCDAAIWVLDPAAWNSKAVAFTPPVGIVSPPNNEVLNSYLPSKDITYRKGEPVALYGMYNSPRIVAQRGTFCLFGKSRKPMETTYIDNGYPQDSLEKLLIPRDQINGLLKSLMRIGITDSVVYPDLDGLALEIRRAFGFFGTYA